MLAALTLGVARCGGAGGAATTGTPTTLATPTTAPLMKIVTPTPAPAGTPGVAPAVPSAAQTAVTQANGTYVVRAGDTLYVIAAKLNVSVQALATANGISNPNSLQVGQILKVPTPGTP